MTASDSTLSTGEKASGSDSGKHQQKPLRGVLKADDDGEGSGDE